MVHIQNPDMFLVNVNIQWKSYVKIKSSFRHSHLSSEMLFA